MDDSHSRQDTLGMISLQLGSPSLEAPTCPPNFPQLDFNLNWHRLGRPVKNSHQYDATLARMTCLSMES